MKPPFSTYHYANQTRAVPQTRAHPVRNRLFQLAL
jgi:hypothetical protein